MRLDVHARGFAGGGKRLSPVLLRLGCWEKGCWGQLADNASSIYDVQSDDTRVFTGDNGSGQLYASRSICG